MSLSSNAYEPAQTPTLGVWRRRLLPFQDASELSFTAGVGARNAREVSSQVVATSRLDEEEAVLISASCPTVKDWAAQ